MATTKATSDPPPETDGVTLDDAIVLAQSYMGAVGKDSRNDFHKYDYASSEAIVAAARAALIKACVTLTRTYWATVASDATDKRVDRKSGEVYELPIYNLKSSFRLAYGSQAHQCEIDWPVIPDSGRPLDKAVAGALTTSLAYFLRDLLLIPRTDEDSTQDRRDDSNHAGTTQRRQPAGAEPGRLGVRGAMNIRQMVRDAGLDFRDFERAIRSKTPDAPKDPAEWPLAWADTVPIWIKRMKTTEVVVAQPDGADVDMRDEEPPF